MKHNMWNSILCGRKGWMIGVLICGMLLLSVPETVQASGSWINMKVTAESPTMIRLSWKAKKVTSYKLFRAQKKKDDNYTKFKLVARLNKKSTGYVDKTVKKNQEYDYMLVGYRNGKKQYTGSKLTYTGLLCYFDEYQVPDAYRSTKEIRLNIGNYGMLPDGYEIYRRESGQEKYQCIAKVKKASAAICRADKKVTAGKTYYYKARSYKTIGKKKYISKYSDVIKMSATNQKGIFQVKSVPEKCASENEMVLMITSGAGNGSMQLSDNGSIQLQQKPDDTSSSVEKVLSVDLKEYSTDGDHWSPVEKENAPVLKAGETVWIRISSVEKLLYPADQLEEYKYCADMIRYNDLTCSFEVDLLQEKGSAFVFEEAYH